ncbi:MAG: hypothetical protein IM600_01250 [Bacteroidetes bacterium]|jgi:hypothetical protein|nr:hypothetical protein [Bacteroidota bacterium]MCA6442029.1 hypothetical protein [Bacteroidota bacterium]
MGIKFIYKILLLILPFTPIVFLYTILDPFKVIYKRSDYYANDGTVKNMDFIATEMFLKHYDEKKFDSFIFGSSRTEAFKAVRWKKFITGTPFHFHASGENIWGIAKKIEFLSEKKVPIKNALILLDKSVLESTVNLKTIIGIKHPISTKTSWEAFHLKYFKAFFKEAFFIKFIKLKYFGGYDDPRLFDMRKFIYDESTNDVYYEWFDEQIRNDSVKFFTDNYELISTKTKDTIYEKPAINESNKVYLTQIAKVLKDNNTNFKIVISPLKDRLFFNKTDLKVLETIFGKEHIYDFSGINYFTSQIYHYYDGASHFRPFIADSMLKVIYKNK